MHEFKYKSDISLYFYNKFSKFAMIMIVLNVLQSWWNCFWSNYYNDSFFSWASFLLFLIVFVSVMIGNRILFNRYMNAANEELLNLIATIERCDNEIRNMVEDKA